MQFKLVEDHWAHSFELKLNDAFEQGFTEMVPTTHYSMQTDKFVALLRKPDNDPI